MGPVRQIANGPRARAPSWRDYGAGTSRVSKKTVVQMGKMEARVRWIWNTRVPTWARVRGILCCIPRVLFTEHAERVSGMRRARRLQARRVDDVISTDLVAQMPEKRRTLFRVGNPTKASAWGDSQGDIMAAWIGRWKGRWHRP